MSSQDPRVLKAMRAFGWVRDLREKESYSAANTGIDPRYLFVTYGYNLCPAEIQGGSLVLCLTWSVEVLRPPGLHSEIAIDTRLYQDCGHLIRYAIDVGFVREIVLTERSLA